MAATAFINFENSAHKSSLHDMQLNVIYIQGKDFRLIRSLLFFPLMLCSRPRSLARHTNAILIQER